MARLPTACRLSVQQAWLISAVATAAPNQRPSLPAQQRHLAGFLAGCPLGVPVPGRSLPEGAWQISGAVSLD